MEGKPMVRKRAGKRDRAAEERSATDTLALQVGEVCDMRVSGSLGDNVIKFEQFLILASLPVSRTTARQVTRRARVGDNALGRCNVHGDPPRCGSTLRRRSQAVGVDLRPSDQFRISGHSMVPSFAVSGRNGYERRRVWLLSIGRTLRPCSGTCYSYPTF